MCSVQRWLLATVKANPDNNRNMQEVKPRRNVQAANAAPVRALVASRASSVCPCSIIKVATVRAMSTKTTRAAGIAPAALLELSGAAASMGRLSRDVLVATIPVYPQPS
jgi:hypothetical protein